VEDTGFQPQGQKTELGWGGWARDGLLVGLADSYVVQEADRGTSITYAVAFERTWDVCFEKMVGVALSPPVMVEEESSPAPSSSPSAQGDNQAGPGYSGDAGGPALLPPPPTPAPTPSSSTASAGSTAGGASSSPSTLVPQASVPEEPVDVAVSARAVKAKVKAGVKARVRVAVTAGASVPVGTLVISWGGTAKTVQITASAKGRATIALPRLPKGRHAIDVAFFDTTGAFEAAAAKRFPITVR
jgi:hypothetical protein